jgi:uncharacterized membrane protein affecting hemolysin expression
MAPGIDNFTMLVVVAIVVAVLVILADIYVTARRRRMLQTNVLTQNNAMEINQVQDNNLKLEEIRQRDWNGV